jgi:hypothetical protein
MVLPITLHICERFLCYPWGLCRLGARALPIEEFLVSETGRGVMPDGFAIIFSERPEMYVVEVELSSHDIDKHIVEQSARA